MELIGVPWTASESSGSRRELTTWIYETLGMVGLGATVVVAQALTRDHLQLPGHQGLVWLGLLMAGRLVTSTRWAGTAAAVSAASVAMLPTWGFNDPFRWLPYLLVGVIVDLAFLGLGRLARHLWLVTLLGGLAYVTKPLSRTAINLATGIPVGTVRLGVAYPVLTHFVFGAAGAAIGGSAVLAARRARRGRKA